MSSSRQNSGALVDHSCRVNFDWAGKTYSGLRGDTLASALLANGIQLIGRSFKYHRPRGMIAAGLDEPNAIVQLEHEKHAIPNLKAPYVEIYEGLVANPVNVWPSLRFDAMAINSLAKRFIPAAFYYKTFMWPNWLLFEGSIRKAAGLGCAPTSVDPDIYSQTSAHCDVLVIGGGIAGIAAALEQGRSGLRVLFVTGGMHWGGRLVGSAETIEGLAAQQWIDQSMAALRSMSNVTLRERTLATGHYDHGLVALCERLSDHLPIADRRGPRQRLWRVRAGRVILATGAFERPLVFANNDRPGIMLAGAALAYLRRYGIVIGQKIVVATNNDSAWASAFELADAGATIVAIVDARPTPPQALIEAALHRGISVYADSAPETTRGKFAVKSVTIATLDAADRISGPGLTLACDALLMSGGWNPAVHLYSQAGGRLAFDAALQSFAPHSIDKQNIAVVGAAAGDYAIASTLGVALGSPASSPLDDCVRPIWSIARGDEPSSSAWVDYQNDVTAGDIALAARENFRSVEHLKRYTTLGMASDQGKTSNVNGIGVLSKLLGKRPDEIGTTRFRPPYDPVTIGVFAGHRIADGLHMRRSLASEDHHIAAGAMLEEYGGWMRPVAYPKPGESEEDAIRREVIAVRSNAGIFDASPLGKIEVKGPDSARFLDRIYVNTIGTLKPKHCRYALMLDENGTVFDDGIVTRLAEDHFLLGTTSGHADAVAELLEEWLQCEWTDLQVLTQNVTTCWGVINIAGPSARAILQTFESDIDFSAAGFPHMQFRSGKIAGMHARVSRVSFSGELSYEIATPWRETPKLWSLLSGKSETAFGIEALMTMRIEKGFLHIGSETDGTTLPQDIGFGRILASKRGDFIGRRSTSRPDAMRTDRRQLVGISVTDGDASPLRIGAHVIGLDVGQALSSEGWITSSAWSPTLDAPVALAMIKAGDDRIGEAVRIWDVGRWREVRVVSPCFYDPQGHALNV